MEFFAIADKKVSVDILHARLDIASLPSWCSSISTVLSHRGNEGEIYCVWGQFKIHRELLLSGVRYSLTNCLNAVAWTITTGFPPAPEKLVIHCTINRTQQDSDFTDSIEQFVQDWRIGLELIL